MLSHYEFIKKTKPDRWCMASDMTFGNRCLNCGWGWEARDPEVKKDPELKRYFRITKSQPGKLPGHWVLFGKLFRPGLPVREYFALGRDRWHALRQLDIQLESDGIDADSIIQGG